MDLTEAERDLTDFFADKLSLTVDQNIFRGQIPAGQNGIAVRIDSILDADRMEPVSCNVQLLAKYPDRDDGLTFVGEVPRFIPCWDVELDHIRIKSLFFRGGNAVYEDTDEGILKTFVSINLVAVLTAAATVQSN